MRDPRFVGGDVDVFARWAPPDQGLVLGHALEAHAALGSTNDRARSLAESGAPHGTVVLAETQTAGRGRRGRSWHSPPGVGLYASFVLRPSFGADAVPLLPLAAGVATARAIEALVPALGAARLGGLRGPRVGLKWPNDCLAQAATGARQKLSGVLAELSLDGPRVRWVVLGIGVNLKDDPARPAELRAQATSIEALAELTLSPALALGALCTELTGVLDRWNTGGAPALVEAWHTHALGLGEPVTLTDGARTVAGALRGIGPGGAIAIQAPDGSLQHGWAGDLALAGYGARLDLPPHTPGI